MAAADCMTRVCALAIATAACVGLPCALVYEIVRAAAERRSGATAAALSVFLVVWVTATAAYYPRVCADILGLSPRGQQARHGRHFDYPGAAVHRELPEYVRGGARVVVGDGDGSLPLAAAPSWERRRDGALVPLPFVARHGGGLNALRREPPAGFGGVARLVGVANGTLAAERCVVCLCDVEKGEAAAWLPACLHMFHRECIDQWLHQHGHSTCPICRRHAFAAPPLTVLQRV